MQSYSSIFLCIYWNAHPHCRQSQNSVKSYLILLVYILKIIYWMQFLLIQTRMEVSSLNIPLFVVHSYLKVLLISSCTKGGTLDAKELATFIHNVKPSTAHQRRKYVLKACLLYVPFYLSFFCLNASLMSAITNLRERQWGDLYGEVSWSDISFPYLLCTLSWKSHSSVTTMHKRVIITGPWHHVLTLLA